MKTSIKINKKNIVYGAILFVIGMFFGRLFFGSNDNVKTTETMEHKHEDAEKETIWACSMHPQIKKNKPGQCPICGMDLVPLEESSEEDSPIQIQMSEAAMRIAEVQTTKVEKTTPYKEIYFPGKVKADERSIMELTARFPGRIEKLNINFTGQKVSKGQVLVKIYSPKLVTAQKELFEAMKYKDSNPQFYQAARNKLKLWDLTDSQIDEIIIKGEPEFYFDVVSPITGTVTIRHIALGNYVKEGTPLFEVVNLSYVWVMFDAYESNIPWVKMGDKIQFTIKSLPGKTFTGKVTFIDPVVNPQTRVAYVRTELSNPGGLLKPNMFVSGILKTMLPGVENALVIPKSAILWTGKRAVVYVKDPHKDKPTFEYREIVLGEDAGNYYVVKDGLKEGEEIVTNGVFSIDAAAQLQGKSSMMSPQGGKTSTGHEHGGMDMGKTKTTEKKEIKPAEDIDPKFQKQLANVYKTYLDMKEAFVASDKEKVKETSLAVKKSLKNVDMKLVKGANHIKWMEQLEIMTKSLDGINSTNDIEKQRNHFAMFSESLYSSLKLFGISNIKIYYQYCPMALDNKGAYWLSDTKEIRNPYFGEKMLKCGSTKETLR